MKVALATPRLLLREFMPADVDALEGILGDTVTPWVWEGYTPEQIKASREKP